MNLVSTVVTRVESPVLYVRATGGPRGASTAFAQLEAALGGPRGRRFWGWLKDGEYRACAARREGDEPESLGLLEGVLPAGPYARARHEGPFEELPRTFAALERQYPVDAARPDLEEYRREGEVWAYLPIRT